MSLPQYPHLPQWPRSALMMSDVTVCVYAGVMHQVKKLCEPDVIDLSSKKTETASASASVPASSTTTTPTADDSSSDVFYTPPTGITPTPTDKPRGRGSESTTASTMANASTAASGASNAGGGQAETGRQGSSTVAAPSGSSPRM